jgi:hypothetical protein
MEAAKVQNWAVDPQEKKKAVVKLFSYLILSSFYIKSLVCDGLFFVPEDEGDMLFQNVRFPPNYTALQPKKPYISSL